MNLGLLLCPALSCMAKWMVVRPCWMNRVSNADVWIEVASESPEATSGPLALGPTSSHATAFARATVDTFTAVGAPVATPTRLRVWRNDAGQDPAWKVAWVAVQPAGAVRETFFVFDTWLKDTSPCNACAPLAVRLPCVVGR